MEGFIDFIPQRVREDLLALVKGNGLYEVESDECTFSVCIFDEKVLTAHSDSVTQLPDTLTKIKIQPSRWLYLYYSMLYLWSRKKLEELDICIPYVCDYDIYKIVQRCECELLDYMLQRMPKRDLPPVAMQTPRALIVFLKNNWTFRDDILFQYYESSCYKFYYLAVILYLEKVELTDDEVKSRMIDIAKERNDIDILQLLT